MKIIAWLLVFLLIGCTGTSINPKLTKFDPQSGYRFKSVENVDGQDDLFVLLSFSGGGTRAAAFSFGILEALKEVDYTKNGKKQRLLNDIDVISSVSGGSFTSMYYGLFRDSIFNDFPETFLYKDVQRDLILRALWPINWLRLARSDFSRIDMAAEYYDSHIFKNNIYNDLLEISRGNPPYIIINATDMTLNSKFEFTQDQFDLLCSDLSGVPVGRAVAASSAFPGLLSPITFRNYSKDRCGYKEPLWLTNALKTSMDNSIETMPNPPRRYFEALSLSSYQRDKAPYVHLLDGGLADNIGLRGPLNAFSTLDSPWSVVQMMNQEELKHIMVIVVNAKTKKKHDWNQNLNPPGIFSVLGLVTSGPMDHYSFDTVDLVKDNFEEMRKDADANTACRGFIANNVKPNCAGAKLPPELDNNINFHSIEIAFHWLINDKQQGLKDCLESLPTSFTLSRETVDLLRQVAKYLLFHSEDFRKAMQGLEEGWQPPVYEIAPSLIKKVCGV